LDEPTVGMDRLEEFGLMDDLRSACAGRTVMVVNHDVRWLLRFCDYFIVLDQGKIVQRGGRELASQSGLFKMLLEADDRTSSLSASAAVG
jgi:ABC-type transport system involved in cytochrome bd biosynthesis fused ATPase/permease subunit